MKTFEIVRDAEVLAEIHCNQLERFGSGQSLQLFDRHGLPFLSAIIMKCELREKASSGPVGTSPEQAERAEGSAPKEKR